MGSGPHYTILSDAVEAAVRLPGDRPDDERPGRIEVWLCSTVEGGELDDGALIIVTELLPGRVFRPIAKARVEEPDRKALSGLVSGQRLTAGSGQRPGPRSGVVLAMEDADGWFGVEFASDKHADEWEAEHQRYIGDSRTVQLLTKQDALIRAGADDGH